LGSISSAGEATQLELRLKLQDRQIGRFGLIKNFIHICCCRPKLVGAGSRRDIETV
jgi:hypothetical protein